MSEAVSLQVVTLNKSHVTHCTSKRLFSCDKSDTQVWNSETHYHITTIKHDQHINIHTSMNENVSLQVVSTPEGPVTVVTDKVLLDFWKWTISIFIHNRLPGKWMEDILIALFKGLEIAMFKRKQKNHRIILKMIHTLYSRSYEAPKQLCVRNRPKCTHS